MKIFEQLKNWFKFDKSSKTKDIVIKRDPDKLAVVIVSNEEVWRYETSNDKLTFLENYLEELCRNNKAKRIG